MTAREAGYRALLVPPANAEEAALVDGLEREYRHVIGLLESAGWNGPESAAGGR